MMSNDLIAQAQAALQGARSQRPTKVAAVVEIESGAQYHRFSFNNGDVAVITPTGERVPAPNSTTHFVVVASAARPGRVYFDGSHTDASPPVCISRDGRIPIEMPTRQSDTCRTCRQNVPGSGATQGNPDAKACSMTMPVAVVPVGLNGDTWVAQNVVVLLRVSGTAFLDGVSSYGMGFKALVETG